MSESSSLQNSILQGDRIALGKAITLIESNKVQDRVKSGELLAGLLKETGNSLRIGITGVPGVGKSTFIEALGAHITKKGKRLAVLAIDPSSPQSKGSILGDKTRMTELSTNINAFIRPSAAAGELGGVANKTMEAILLCEAAGYDIILIETVGVGQSEIAVKNMTDVFLLLMLAGAGDELQGIKRGIMEMADVLVINKADGDNIKPANLARKAYENALHLFSPRESQWTPPVLTCSSLENEGVEKVWETLLAFQENQIKTGSFQLNRARQKKLWLNNTFNQEIFARIKERAEIKELMRTLEEDVMANRITPYQAADRIIQKALKN